MGICGSPWAFAGDRLEGGGGRFYCCWMRSDKNEQNYVFFSIMEHIHVYTCIMWLR